MTRRFFSFTVAGAFVPAALLTASAKDVSDDALTDRIRIKLASDQVVKGGAIGVDVKQGVVTLSGTVDSETRKSKAEKIAKKISGVKSVVNQIQVVTK
jgi:hyperosmotically inducible protein